MKGDEWGREAEGSKDYGVDTVKEESGVIGYAGEVDGQEKAEGEMKGMYVVEFISLWVAV